MRKTNSKTYILAGVMFVVILLLTWLARIDLAILREGKPSGACATLGDVGLYIALLFLPAPWAALAAGLGAALADIIAGSAIYAPATLVIKAAMTFIAYWVLHKKEPTWLNCIKAVGFSGVAMILLYFVYDLLLLGSYQVAALSLPINVLQMLACAVIAVPVLKLFFGKSYSKDAPAFDAANTTTKRTLK